MPAARGHTAHPRAGADPGVVYPVILAVDGDPEPMCVDFPEARIPPSARHRTRGPRGAWPQTRLQRLEDLMEPPQGARPQAAKLCDDAIVGALAKRLDRVCALGLEDAERTNLLACARGTALDPGRNVSAKRALNRRFPAVAPARIRRRLSSVCAQRGVWLVMTLEIAHTKARVL